MGRPSNQDKAGGKTPPQQPPPGDTPGGRLYLIRLALGDGHRNPESMRAFSDRVFHATRVRYHPNTISLLERGEQSWRREDFIAFAAVDVLQRGAVWLSALDVAAAPAVRPSDTPAGTASGAPRLPLREPQRPVIPRRRKSGPGSAG